MERLPARGEDPEEGVLERAGLLLRAGHLLIYPTDTFYAIGGMALDPAVCRRVRTVKGRDAAQPLPTVAGDLAQAKGLCSIWPGPADLLSRRFWPGPLTLVLPARADVPEELTGPLRSVGVRVPALKLTRELCLRAGPLVSTSANASGAKPPLTCAEAIDGVGGGVALALDAGPGRSLPSTLVDLTGDPFEARSGAVPWDEIREVLLRGVP